MVYVKKKGADSRQRRSKIITNSKGRVPRLARMRRLHFVRKHAANGSDTILRIPTNYVVCYGAMQPANDVKNIVWVGSGAGI
jgi:hypothetical protein